MDRIVDIATDGRHLSMHRGFLIVEEDRAEVSRIALDDVHAVIVHAHGTTWSANLIAALDQPDGAIRRSLRTPCRPIRSSRSEIAGQQQLAVWR